MNYESMTTDYNYYNNYYNKPEWETNALVYNEKWSKLCAYTRWAEWIKYVA